MATLLTEKITALENWLRNAKRIALCYSGGVDSTLLLDVAFEILGGHVTALHALSPAQPATGNNNPVEFCRQRGIRLVEFPLGENGIPGFFDNPPERCYLCKRHLLEQAQALIPHPAGCVLCDGSIADDLQEDRPGRRAGEEWGVQSPLALCGFSKSDVRDFSRLRGLATWDAPSFTCLYTRFPFGTPLATEKLPVIEQAEQLLSQHGFSSVRVRAEGPAARIEVDPDQVARLRDWNLLPQLRAILEQGFKAAAIDGAGYQLGGANSPAQDRELQWLYR